MGVALAAALIGPGAIPAAAQTTASRSATADGTAPEATAATLIYAVDLTGGRPALERANYVWGGRNYCWYEGWRGPGWYWCGYGWRRGAGWGGGNGWHGWRGGRGGGYGGGYHGGNGGHGGGDHGGRGGHGGGDHGGRGGHEGGDHHHG
jgi:hypothetical protein